MYKGIPQGMSNLDGQATIHQKTKKYTYLGRHVLTYTCDALAQSGLRVFETWQMHMLGGL
jgi:hypothetical protein